MGDPSRGTTLLPVGGCGEQREPGAEREEGKAVVGRVGGQSEGPQGVPVLILP